MPLSLLAKDVLRSANLDSNTPLTTQQKQTLLRLVDDAQTLFWELLGRLENATGLELDSSEEYRGLSLSDLYDMGEDGDGGGDDAETICECGRPERDCAVFYGSETHRDRA